MVLWRTNTDDGSPCGLARRGAARWTMRGMTHEVLAALYVGAGLFKNAFYVPQIIALSKDTTRAASTSIVTWTAWLVAAAITVIYAAIIVNDRWFFLISTANLTGTTCVLIIALVKRNSG